MTVIAHLRHVALALQDVAVAALPDGGQRAARRNAWGAMAVGSARARARLEADGALRLALLRFPRAGAKPVTRAR